MTNLASGPAAIPARIAGLELWRGPSAFDGAEIMVLATFRSDNVKTGNMIQTWLMRTDELPTKIIVSGRGRSVCGTCPLQHKSSGGSSLCYVNLLTLNQVFTAWAKGNYPKFDRKRHLHLFRGRMLRLGSHGDPVMCPRKSWDPFLKACNGHTGYTHQWREPFAQGYRDILMASVETDSSAGLARAAGWRPFRIRRADENLMANERVCPAAAEGGRKVSCSQCMACNGARGRRNLAGLAIVVHGGLNTPERFTAISHEGGFVATDSQHAA